MPKVWSTSVLLLVFLSGLLILTGHFLSGLSKWFLWNSMTNIEWSINVIDFLFVNGIMLASISVFWWSKFYMSTNSSLNFFFITLLLFVASMLVLVMSKTIFLLFLGWEGLGLTSFVLILFYQNWSGSSGGLNALMTNRLGDSMMMLSYSYLILVSQKIELSLSLLLWTILVCVAMTKSAQVPFSGWLPLAMAAPTPVSALVHSSTLVVAGVWLLIKFSQFSYLEASLYSMIGLVTMLMASLAAIFELDGKKIVALSTLSQLGLVFISVSLSGVYFSLFHLLMHAFAKANLFLMVGFSIHMQFSQQDTRFFSLLKSSPLILLSSFSSLLSLSGMMLLSGFYSKEMILTVIPSQVSSFLLMFVLMSIITLTFSYSMKLFVLMFMTSSKGNIIFSNSSIGSSSSFIILSLSNILLGSVFVNEFIQISPHSYSYSGLYWLFLIFSFVFIVNSPFSYNFFSSICNLTFNMVQRFFSLNSYFNKNTFEIFTLLSVNSSMQNISLPSVVLIVTAMSLIVGAF